MEWEMMQAAAAAVLNDATVVAHTSTDMIEGMITFFIN